MRVTVAICTWNRCALLRETLERMTQLKVPPHLEWEILVVNNNCTDETDSVIASFADQLPVRRIFEPQPGQSYARNYAVEHAAGDYIIWTDDDVLVGSNWLAAYCEAFARWPDAAVFGGPVEPWFEGSPPRWLLRSWPRISSVYAIRELGEEPFTLSQKVVPFGANYAVRAVEQRQHPYDTRRGLKPNSSIRGEETAVIRAILNAGNEGWWVPQARVQHFIPPHRQTVRYVRSYFTGQGELIAANVPNDSQLRWLGRPLWLWRQALTLEAKYLLRRVLGSPEEWTPALIDACTHWGIAKGMRAGRN